MAARYIGAIDQGTTGTRCMVFDVDGDVIAQAYETHEQVYPEPGWVEHDPMEIWETTKRVVLDCLAQAGVNAQELVGFGVANQRETTVLWEAETGQPLHNAIVWQDRRTTERVEELEDRGLDEYIRQTTGLAVDSYFSATKAEWLLDNATSPRSDGDLRDRADELMLGTIDSWLIYNLTGEHITDVSNAARTMLFDIHELEWDETLLQEFEVPRRILPEVRPSSDPTVYGYTDPDGFLNRAIPVAGALGDQQAALFGQTCFEPGEAKSTTGTGSFYLLNTGTEPIRSDHGLLTTIGYQLGDEDVVYALEGSIFVTGAVIEWLGDLDLIDDAAHTADLAASVESTEDVYFVPAFTGLGAPHWDGRARGTIVGLTRGTRKEHLVRAALESIAFQTRDIATAMEADSGIETSSLRVDGGAVENEVLCQLQADILQTNISRPVMDETTALGAAYAAGLALGYWDSLAELRSHRAVDQVFTPSMRPDVAEERHERWREAVNRSLGWAESH